jgi:methionyl-tRNA formyltransferase
MPVAREGPGCEKDRVMKILFAGTPAIAVPSLRAVATQFDIVGVLTNPDRPRGRGRVPLPSPVKELALELGLPVFQFESLRTEARERVRSLGADILVVYAYGRIFGPKFLQLFPLGGINVHPSLLPAYRGSIPIVATILNGDSETGITVQKIALELDSGDILLQTRIPLKGDIDAGKLTDIAAHRGAELLVETLEKIEAGTLVPVPQDHSRASYCRQLRKEDGVIEWGLPAFMIERMVRAYRLWPKAYTFFRGTRLSILKSRVLDEDGEGGESSRRKEKLPAGTVLGIDRKKGILVQTGRGVLCVEELQLQGKKALAWDAFMNGNRDIEGSILGEI